MARVTVKSCAAARGRTLSEKHPKEMIDVE
jgi:hypothetical protein